jgi:hypothetical protein
VLDGGVLVLHCLRKSLGLGDDLSKRLPGTRLGARNGWQAFEFCACNVLNAARINSGALQGT